ncbi:MAG: SGNH/GDSL hydrolase family protein [Brevundimonas sp.]|uniref:SGNH/GDSL hydrolase family protein n=1 Tax=Brevundimonas sp. TaxID=1871086 RepID=UPI00391CB925
MKSGALAFALLAAAPAVAAGSGQAAPPACPVSADHVIANDGLDRSRAAVAAGRLTILAMGSSSIEGVGATRRELGFTPLLEAGLEQRLPGVEVTVINKGIGGETAKDTADRLVG